MASAIYLAVFLCPALIFASTQHPLLDQSLLPWSSVGGGAGASRNVTSANYVFNSLASLLLQLPNTLHPNGHTIVPATIAAHTLLYHARTDVIFPPPSPEWLAFDPEMSFSIMANLPWNSTHLITYSARRDLKVLVFDGMSAEWGSDGVLDTQEVLIARKGGVLCGRGWFDDYERAKQLCEWGKGNGVEGFVRMNAGFEVLWCDYSVGLDLVSHLNITAPDSPPRMNGTGPPDRHDGGGGYPPPNWPPSRNGSAEPPRGPPGRGPGGGGGPRWGAERSPFTASSGYEWLRIATRRFDIPQPYVRLVPSGLVTFYDPQFRSLLNSRRGKSMSGHRVWSEVSDEDADKAVSELEDVLHRPDLWTQGGVDWIAMSREVVERWGDRLAQIRNTVLNETETNATRKLEQVKLLSYTLLNPYIDTRSLSSSRESDLDVWLPPALDRCITSRTIHIPESALTSQERLLKASIESVTGRLCDLAGALFSESLNPSDEAGSLAHWTVNVRELMEWLDWAMWTRCNEACGWNSVCTVPIWPVMMGRHHFPGGGDDNEDYNKPKCIRFEEWISRPQGRF